MQGDFYTEVGKMTDGDGDKLHLVSYKNNGDLSCNRNVTK